MLPLVETEQFSLSTVWSAERGGNPISFQIHLFFHIQYSSSTSIYLYICRTLLPKTQATLYISFRLSLCEEIILQLHEDWKGEHH